MPREFKATPATRKAVPLLIGLAGAPGSGKTFSALRLATGIKAHRHGPIVVIDTERNRALAYAPPEGATADNVNNFDFYHVPFTPPFRSTDFLDAVMQQRSLKPSCIIIDSLSDEHEGEGGMLDYHEAQLDKMAGDDWSKRERVGQAAWIKPKHDRLEMMNGLFQMMTPIICCFRAREKTKQLANDKGKMVPTNIGWTPIAPSEIVHNMSLFAILPIKSDGLPMWKGNTAYEDFTIKLPRQFQKIVPEGRVIDEAMGKAMSEWAAGDTKFSKEGDKSRSQSATAAPATPTPTGGDQASTAAGQTSGSQNSTTAQPNASPSDDEFPGDRAVPLSAATDGAQTADPKPDTSDSAATASGASQQPQKAMQEPLQQRDDSSGDEAFVDFAAEVAAAKDWPSINLALRELGAKPVFLQADKPRKNMCRRIAFLRLRELQDAGYSFDHLSDIHAYRASIEGEDNLDALEGNRRVVSADKIFMNLDTRAKIALDNAYADRVAFLKTNAPSTQEFE